MSGNQKKPFKNRDINRLLSEEDGALEKLYNHARVLIEIRESLKNVIPSRAFQHITVANIHDEALIIHADSAAWAARLRFYIPEMLKSLNANNACTGLKTIRIKVIPADTAPHPGADRKLRISSNTARLLKHVAGSIEDSDLRDSLLRLARNR